MTAVDIAVIVVVSVAFVAAVGIIVWRKLKHKSGCDCCDCHSCNHCNHCNPKHPE